MSKIPSKLFFNFPVYKTAPNNPLETNLDNTKKLTLVCSALNENTQEFLYKVMQAINIDLVKDANLIDNLPANTAFSHLAEETQSDIFLFFGKKPEEMCLHVHCAPYQIISLYGKQLLFGNNLEIIQNTPLQKKALWNALQQLFPRVSDGS